MPDRLHERALRLHVARTRAVTLTDNPWLTREDAHLSVPLFVTLADALADVLEYLVDTHGGPEAFLEYRTLIRGIEAVIPQPLQVEEDHDPPSEVVNAWADWVDDRTNRSISDIRGLPPTEAIDVVMAA